MIWIHWGWKVDRDRTKWHDNTPCKEVLPDDPASGLHGNASSRPFLAAPPSPSHPPRPPRHLHTAPPPNHHPPPASRRRSGGGQEGSRGVRGWALSAPDERNPVCTCESVTWWVERGLAVGRWDGFLGFHKTSFEESL